MGAVSQRIPNLLGGISQQPDPVKLPGQVREAVNVHLDPTFGCRKRPATQFIAQLATNVPQDTKWFSIFRDNNERYAVAIYYNPNFTLRVWELNNGTEVSVNTTTAAAEYFAGSTIEDLTHLTIADYTLLCNKKRQVTMSSSVSPPSQSQALAIINSVGYNTTYSIDLGSDTNSTPVAIYKATKLSITPGSYEVNDYGLCDEDSAEDHSVNSGGKTGLQFRIINNCAAYLRKLTITTPATFGFEILSGPTTTGVYEYTVPKLPDVEGATDMIIRVNPKNKTKAYRVKRLADGAGFPVGYVFDTPQGHTIRVKSVKTKVEEVYVSRYTTDVILKNGGVGWQVGDEVTVTQSGRSFTVRVDAADFVYSYGSDGQATYTTPTDSSGGTLSVGLITTNLVTAVNGISGYTADSIGNIIRITRSDGKDFNISVRGGLADKAMTALNNTAQDISQLPTQCWDGFILKVVNTEEADSDDYYVKFISDTPGVPGAGTWEETVKPGITTNLNQSTMPHSLERLSDGTFVLKAIDSDSAFDGWGTREVGDEKTNPEPSFVGKTITSMFFFQNRLGFLSNDAVIMSQAGSYFDFFVQSAVAISDADPIDMTAPSTKPSYLKAAIGAPKGLLLFSERGQFLLSTSESAYSASTAKITEISSYFYNSTIPPLSNGVSVIWAAQAKTYSKVLEMALESIEGRPAVADITRIIPEYLPTNLKWGEVMPNRSMIVYGDGTENVAVFSFYNSGNERQMAGWVRWVFPHEIKMWGAEDDTSYLVTYDGTRHTLVRMQLIDDPDDAPLDLPFSSFTPSLDSWIPKSAVTITTNDVVTKRVYIPSYLRPLDPIYTLISIDETSAATFVSPPYIDEGSDRYLIIENDLADGDFILGLTYTATLVLPAFFMAQGGSADRVNYPVVQTVTMEMYYSGSYTATIEKQGYDPVTLELEATISNSYNADEPPIDEIHSVTIPVCCRGDQVKITFESDAPYPCSFTGYSWAGHYNNRGISTVPRQ